MTTWLHNWRAGLRLTRDERGTSTVEYAIVLCLVAALGVGVWQKFGANVKKYTGNADSMISKQLDQVK